MSFQSYFFRSLQLASCFRFRYLIRLNLVQFKTTSTFVLIRLQVSHILNRCSWNLKQNVLLLCLFVFCTSSRANEVSLILPCAPPRRHWDLLPQREAGPGPLPAALLRQREVVAAQHEKCRQGAASRYQLPQRLLPPHQRTHLGVRPRSMKQCSNVLIC